MGKESQKRRRFKIRLKQKRKEKIKKLLEKLQLVQDQKERKRILKKIFKINPNLTQDDVLNLIKKHD